jgi:ribosomal protein L7/L12
MSNSFIFIIAAGVAGALVLFFISAGRSSASGPAPTMEDVKQALATGDKILAIKLYRQMTQVGLKEAKDAVERLDLGR